MNHERIPEPEMGRGLDGSPGGLPALARPASWSRADAPLATAAQAARTPADASMLVRPGSARAPLAVRDVRAVDAVSASATEAVAEAPRLVAEGLDAYFGATHAVHGVSLSFRNREVTAIIGPSGCGKSTLLRCFNRMHETVPSARATGRVLLDGRDIYASGVNAVAVRRRIGMVFQRPTPFPTMSVRDNVAAGLRVLGKAQPDRHATDAIVERALRRAALWDEVKDRLGTGAVALSGGQQQRLCIARALASEPEVLLLDEPTAALDPVSTQRVEELVYELRAEMAVVIVTHNMQQAARVSDRTAFMLAGDLVEVAATQQLFTAPVDGRTEAYITGRFG